MVSFKAVLLALIVLPSHCGASTPVASQWDTTVAIFHSMVVKKKCPEADGETLDSTSTNANATAVAKAVEGLMTGYLFDKQFLKENSQANNELKCVSKNTGFMVEEFVAALMTFGASLESMFTGGNVNAMEMVRTPSMFREVIQVGGSIARCCIPAENSLVLQVYKETLATPKLELVGERLLFNGIDVATDLLKAAHAFKLKKFTSFGLHIGQSLRSIILRTPNDLPRLNDPDRARHATMGFMDGFFGTGKALADVHVVVGSIDIDMQHCIGSKGFLFMMEAVWSSVVLVVAQEKGGSGSSKHRRLSMGDDKPPVAYEWAGPLSAALMQVPQVLISCGITPDQASMLTDAVGSFAFKFPLHEVTASTMAGHLQEAKKFWKLSAKKDVNQTEDYNSWFKFGKEMGLFLQDMVVFCMPQKYTIDSSRKLQRLVGSIPAGKAGSLSPFATTSAIVASMVLLLFVFVALATRRASTRYVTRSHSRILRLNEAECEVEVEERLCDSADVPVGLADMVE